MVLYIEALKDLVEKHLVLCQMVRDLAEACGLVVEGFEEASESGLENRRVLEELLSEGVTVLKVPRKPG